MPKSCEKIIKGVTKSNKNRSKSKQANPYAVAFSNEKCREDYKKYKKSKKK